MRRISTALLATFATCATLALTPVVAAQAAAPRGAASRPVDARAITWHRLMTRITVAFDGNRLEDVMKFVSDFSGADLEPLWIDDRRAGLDPDAEIELDVSDVTVLTLLERVLEQVQDDFDPNTWQFSRAGAFEMGPKSRLNKKATLKVYDINDLLFEIPNYPEVPSLDLDQILNQSQQGGGGGGGSIFENEDVGDDDSLTKQELADNLQDLIEQSIEPDQWASAGGDGATITYHDGHFLIRAPDYIHRQIVGYPFALSEPAPRPRRSTTQQGRTR
ncbi:MAG: hypothetical protein RLN60_02530 [Phycisphaerales bacterium]